MAFVLKNIDTNKFIRGVTNNGSFDVTDDIAQAKVYPTSVEGLDDALLFRVRGQGKGQGQGQTTPRLQFFDVQPLVLGEGI